MEDTPPFPPAQPPTLQHYHRFLSQTESLRPATVRLYLHVASSYLASNLDPDSYLLTLSCQPRTRHQYGLALRRYLRYSGDGAGLYIPADERHPKPQPTYSREEVSAILGAAKSPRDKALVLTFYDCGLRASELLSMRPNYISRAVHVEGKTGSRTVPLGQRTTSVLLDYRPILPVPPASFWSGQRGALTVSGLGYAVERLAKLANVAYRGLHAFRRACAVELKRLGVSDSDIMTLLGWQDTAMLRRYTSVYAAELASEAHRRASPGDAL